MKIRHNALLAVTFLASIIAFMHPSYSQQAAPKVRTSNAPTGAMLGAPDYLPTKADPIGWRGDGSGIYPGAIPPTTWNRRVKGEPVLACSAKKPGNTTPSVEKTISLALNEWLVLGPFKTSDKNTGMAATQILETAVEPDLGMKTGDLTWETMKMDGYLAWLAEKFGEPPHAPNQAPWDPPKELNIVYAHTYIYSEEGGKAKIRATASQGIKMWLNGKPIMDATTTRDGAISDGPAIELIKGWNRLLFKLWGWNSAWGFTAWIEQPASQTREYEESNIQWKMPAYGGGIAPPIIVGDKIIMAVDPDYVVCLNKKDGKPVWISSANYFDATLDDLKKEFGILRLQHVRTAGNLITLVSSKPLDPASAANPASYQVTGAKPAKAELTGKDRVVRLTTASPVPDGTAITIGFKGLKSADGETPKEDLKFTTSLGRPVTGDLLKEFLIGEIRKNIDPAKILDEEIVKPDAKPASGEQWKTAKSDDGTFDLNGICGNLNNALIHACTYVFSDADKTVQLWLGSDDGVRAAVNGTVVHKNPASRGVSADQDKVQNVKLRKGWNTLVLSISQGGGGCGFCARIMDEKGEKPQGLTYLGESPEKAATTAPTDEELLAGADASIVEKAESLLKSLQEINNTIVKQGNGSSEVDSKRDLGKERGNIEGQLGALLKSIDPKRSASLAGAWELGQCGWSLTPACDGKNICVYFQHGVAACFDLNGKKKWAALTEFGGNTHHGFSNSPFICDGKFICKQRKLWAYDVETGKLLWEQGTGGTWASLTSAYTGKEWVFADVGPVRRVSDGTVCTNLANVYPNSCASPTRTRRNGFGHIGPNNTFLLVDFDGNGEPVKKSISLQKTAPGGGDWAGGIISTALVQDGYVYLVTEGGLLIVLSEKDGKEAYRKQLNSRSRFAYVSMPGVVGSPAIAGKYIYIMDDYATTFVLEPGPAFKQVSRNLLHDLNPNWADACGQHLVMSTPVFDEGRMYIRIGWNLWCIGEK